MPTIIVVDGTTFTLKKYPEFGAGTPASTDIILFADPVSGVLLKTTISSLLGSGSYFAPLWTEPANLTIGSSTFTDASLVGATELTFIIVNNVIETVNEGFTFNSGTGTIDRSPNQFFAGDKMITPYKSA